MSRQGAATALGPLAYAAARRIALALTFWAVAGAAIAARPGGQDGGRLNLGRSALAVQGYDVVAYFTDGRAVKGRPEYVAEWQGATWRFASAASRDRFLSAPAQYAPQYGGFCAYAVSRNYTADIDPEAWSIVNGRLFLNYSKRVRTAWLAERDANIARGDANWPALSRQK